MTDIGGARGCAHIGALKVLERAGIEIDMVVGTSIGAVVGSSYAMTADPLKVEQRFSDFVTSDQYKSSGLDMFKRREPAENFFGQVATTIKERVVVNLAQSKTSLVGEKRLKIVMDALIPDGRIEDTKISFHCIASNVLTGEQVTFSEGDMRAIVSASASIPGFLPPCKINGYVLVDGSVVCPIPILPARELGADVVIAVDVGLELRQREGDVADQRAEQYRPGVRGADQRLRGPHPDPLGDSALNSDFERRIPDRL